MEFGCSTFMHLDGGTIRQVTKKGGFRPLFVKLSQDCTRMAIRNR